MSDDHPTSDPSRTLLGGVLLFYMIGITVVITVMPFRFRMPTHLDIHTIGNARDLIGNVFLFIPTGFLYALFRRTGRWTSVLEATLVGATLSLVVESAQLLLPERETTISDLVTNTIGAGVGAVLYLLARRRLQSRGGDAMLLELPLVNLLYLLIPLGWSCALAIGRDAPRSWLLLLPGAIGALVIAQVYRHRLHHLRHIPRGMLVLVTVGWFLVAAFPALMRFPVRMGLFAAILGLMTWLIALPAVDPALRERRFEIPTLRNVLLLFGVYLVLTVMWPSAWSAVSHSFVGIVFPVDDIPLRYLLRLVETLAAFTLLGYLLAEFLGRRTGRGYLGPLLLALVLNTVGFEILRALRADYPFLWGNALATLGMAAIGAAVYRLQRRVWRARRWFGADGTA